VYVTLLVFITQREPFRIGVDVLQMAHQILNIGNGVARTDSVMLSLLATTQIWYTWESLKEKNHARSTFAGNRLAELVGQHLASKWRLRRYHHHGPGIVMNDSGAIGTEWPGLHGIASTATQHPKKNKHSRAQRKKIKTYTSALICGLR
jgi:hypothetical protein